METKMEIDFHFGVTYVVARIAGFERRDAEIIATSAQYVDDTVNNGTINFDSNESYWHINTAHAMNDKRMKYQFDERMTWVPFHFLPGNSLEGKADNDFLKQMVCRPNSRVAQEMV